MPTSAVISAILWAMISHAPDVQTSACFSTAFTPHEVAAPDPPVRKSSRNIKAKLVRVKPKQRQMVVRMKWKGVKTFDVADDARITRNGEPVRLQKLRPDDQLRLRVRHGSDGPEVILIHAWMPLESQPR